LSPPPAALALALRAATDGRLPARERLTGTELLPAGQQRGRGGGSRQDSTGPAVPPAAAGGLKAAGIQQLCQAAPAPAARGRP
jgi:hypothetical protein